MPISTYLRIIYHEGTSVNSIVGNTSVSGDNALSYSLSGTGSSDFYVTSEGEIKLTKNLSYNTKKYMTLTFACKEETIY